MKEGPGPASQDPIQLLSIVIPCRNEEGAIASMVEHLYVELRLHEVEHEIVPVDDGSTDSTWAVLEELARLVHLTPALVGPSHSRVALRAMP